MAGKWHTNKTKPNTQEIMDMLIIWKDGDVTIDIPNINEFGRLYLVRQEQLWVDIKDQIKYWQSVEKLFKKELKEIELTKEK